MNYSSTLAGWQRWQPGQLQLNRFASSAPSLPSLLCSANQGTAGCLKPVRNCSRDYQVNNLVLSTVYCVLPPRNPTLTERLAPATTNTAIRCKVVSICFSEVSPCGPASQISPTSPRHTLHKCLWGFQVQL